MDLAAVRPRLFQPAWRCSRSRRERLRRDCAGVVPLPTRPLMCVVNGRAAYGGSRVAAYSTSRSCLVGWNWN